MHEVTVQVCFVVGVLVSACTTGTVYTDHPSLVEAVAPVVYVDNAPRRVISYYNLFSVPVPVLEYRRTYRKRGIYTHAVPHRRHMHRHNHRTKVVVKSLKKPNPKKGRKNHPHKKKRHRRR